MSGLDMDALLAELASLRERKKDLRAAETYVIEQISDLQETRNGRKQFDTDRWRVKLSHSINRKWDSEELVRHVVARALDERTIDPDTGEVEASYVAVTRALTGCAHIDYWRMGGLKSHGLQPDEFYEETSRTKSCQIIALSEDEPGPETHTKENQHGI